LKDLILEALRASVKQYPEVIPLLRGDAALYAMVYAHKVGEAPDDDVRVRDENLLTEKIAVFLALQRRRIIKALKEQYKDFQLGFWDTEVSRMWAELGQDFVGILLHGMTGGLNLLEGGLDDQVGVELIQGNLIRYARRYRDTWLELINATTREFVETAVAEWLASGEPLDELVKILSNPELGIFSEMRARRIAVTEVTRLNALANQAVWEAAEVIREFTWMTAMDERVCDVCGANHGQVFPLAQLDELIPAHPNCLPGDALVSPIGGVSAGSERWYEGDVVIIETLENNLTVTPNHPVLTDCGWVAAGKLKQGDYILGYTSAEWESTIVQVNNQHMVSTIKDVFSSLDLAGLRMPTAAPDFHGDGAGSDVAVIRPNREVVNNVNPHRIEPTSQHNFAPGDVVSEIALPSVGTFTEFLEGYVTVAGCLMSGSDLALALLGRHSTPFDLFCLGLGPGHYSRVDYPFPESTSINASLFCKGVLGLPFNISLQKVVKVWNDDFVGHVYNLQTDSGMYLANGIITHNCRCWPQPIVDRELSRQRMDRIMSEYGL